MIRIPSKLRAKKENYSLNSRKNLKKFKNEIR
jgi:hypothetical protein